MPGFKYSVGDRLRIGLPGSDHDSYICTVHEQCATRADPGFNIYRVGVEFEGSVIITHYYERSLAALDDAPPDDTTPDDRNLEAL